MTAGFGMMASKSPFAGVAIGEGGLAGMQAYGTERQREDWFVVCQVGQTRKDGSFPAYATSNLGGNISRLRERIESLSRVAEQRERVRAALAAETADGYREYLPEPACAVCPERGFERDAIHHFASEHRYHAFVPAP